MSLAFNAQRSTFGGSTGAGRSLIAAELGRWELGTGHGTGQMSSAEIRTEIPRLLLAMPGGEKEKVEEKVTKDTKTDPEESSHRGHGGHGGSTFATFEIFQGT